jgi:nicotinamidase-related amidase
MENANSNPEFFAYLKEWLAGMKSIGMAEAFPDPQKGAILSQDLIKGFCSIGPLASPRVDGIVKPVANFFQSAWSYGVRNILLFQDAHEPDAIEFNAYPPHCVRGTAEAETVEEFKALPFFDKLPVFTKNSISSGIKTGFDEWLAAKPEVDTFVVVGDCTDICIYQLAMYLRTTANASQIKRRVIVPAQFVQTYDRPLAVAREQGGFPHPGDLLHEVYLYHMALNDVEIVQRIN